ncbi:hypothetical protein [Vallitalea okinawensis]|uniref:hypothetical protein n=1 Tax=Vallitalea okinawensis TaxID=2078660 RepID=UPI000CFBDD19|nr:hypothetical protein [Vallitalea okinawensis]
MSFIKKRTSHNYDIYESRGHIIGRITLLTGLIFTFLPPLFLWLVYGIMPPSKELINGIISISSVMLPVSIVEILAFSPMLGTNAMYMSYLTGNIANIKLPSAAIALEVAEVKPSTEEGDIIATIAIGGSVIASEIVILIGMLLIVPLSTKLNNPVIQPVFQQILPALFGSIGAYYILKEWKLAIAPLSVAILLNLVGDLPTAVTIPLCILSSILTARLLYKKKLIKVTD